MESIFVRKISQADLEMHIPTTDSSRICLSRTSTTWCDGRTAPKRVKKATKCKHIRLPAQDR